MIEREKDSKKSLTALLAKWIDSVGHEEKVEGGDNQLSYRSMNYEKNRWLKMFTVSVAKR